MSRITRPLLAAGDVGVGPRQVDRCAPRPAACTLTGPRLRQVGDVQHLDPLLVADVGVAELGRHRVGLLKHVVAQHRRHFGLFRVVQLQHHQAGVAADVGVGAHDRDGVRAAQQAVGVVGQVALQEVVERVAVQQRAGTDLDQALVLVGDVDARRTGAATFGS